MDLTGELYLITGLAALALGAAVLLPRGRRIDAGARAFGAACGAIALWSLAIAARRAGWLGSADALHPSLLGGFFSAPIALHCTLVMARRVVAARRWLVAAYVAAGLAWVSSFTPLHDFRTSWNAACIALLGAIFGAALVVLVRTSRELARGPDRWLWRVVMVTAALAVVLGLSDLLPRAPGGVPRLGPVAVLALLLMLFLLVMRTRLFHVDRVFARGAALVVAASAAALIVQAVVSWRGPDPVALFVACLAIVASAGPLARLVSSGAEALIDPGRRSVARALAATSRELQLAASADDIWRLLEGARRALPDGVRLVVHLAEDSGYAMPIADARVAGASPLARRLERDRDPVMRTAVADEIRFASAGFARTDAVDVLAQMEALGLEVAAPLFREARLVGWIGLGGGEPQRYVSGDVAAALLAVGHQAVATLERLEAQETMRRRGALAAVGEMAAGLAHEVRNPVGAIRGAAQVLATARDPAQAREMLTVIEEETDRLGRVVGEFLDYARPGAPRREPVRLEDLVRRVLRDADAAGWGLRAEVTCPDGVPAAAGDRDQLQRALANLVRNAREAAGAEGTLRVDVGPDGDSRVAVRLQDDGPGIPASVSPRLFQPFHTTKPDGTGLGLALVHRVATDHGGEVRVDPGEGRGATFTLVLPAWHGEIP